MTLPFWTSLALIAIGLAGSGFVSDSTAQPTENAAISFSGEKTSWHGFDRYDFLMDEGGLAIKPFKAEADEHDGIKHQVPGQRRCVIVVPQVAAPGNPWSWRGCYWDHQPQTEVELLKRGFHIAYVESSATLKPGRQWEAWHYCFSPEQQLDSPGNRHLSA